MPSGKPSATPRNSSTAPKPDGAVRIRPAEGRTRTIQASPQSAADAGNEPVGALAQAADLAVDDGGRVRLDFADGRFLPDVARAEKLRADQRTQGVSVPARPAGPFGDPEIDILFRQRIAARVAENLAVPAAATVRRAEYEPDQLVPGLADQIAALRHLLIAPAREVEPVPVQGLEIGGQGGFGCFRPAGVDEAGAELFFRNFFHHKKS